jgi:hypothetical protein
MHERIPIYDVRTHERCCEIQCVEYLDEDELDIFIQVRPGHTRCHTYLLQIIEPGWSFLRRWLLLRRVNAAAYSGCLLCGGVGQLGPASCCNDRVRIHEKEIARMIHIGFLCRELVGDHLLAELWELIMCRVVG